MVYLFLGEDNSAKDEKIAQIKKKHLSSYESLEFDYEVLYGAKLDPKELKKALIALPAIAKRRLVLIHTVHKLSPHNKNLILEFVQAKHDQPVLVLDSDEADSKNSFIKKIIPFATVANFQKGPKINVFDVTNAMTRRRPTEALKILSELLSDGTHPLQIMGGLVWFWGKSKTRLSQEKFQKGLHVLEEADLNIKRSRLKPEHAIEVSIIKLCSLIAS